MNQASNIMTKIGDLLASITGEPSPSTMASPPPKRKADDDLRRPVEKSQKRGLQVANCSKPLIQPSKFSATDSSVSNAKVVQNSQSVIRNSATSTFKNGQPTPPPMNDAPKALKKGSFAEIMARGKAAQTTLGQIGKIQHKKIEKLPSKRERAAMQIKKGKSIQKRLASSLRRRSRRQQWRLPDMLGLPVPNLVHLNPRDSVDLRHATGRVFRTGVRHDVKFMPAGRKRMMKWRKERDIILMSRIWKRLFLR
jgi:hypothetical protein